MKILKRQKGFTLVELLVVIGILAVLLAIVLIAINPQDQFKKANNTARQADVSAILNAISAYMVENNGTLPAGITATVKTIAKTGTETVDLCATLVPTHIADLPQDPQTGTKTPEGSVCTAATAYSTGYTVQASGNRVTVSAPDAQDETIAVTR